MRWRCVLLAVLLLPLTAADNPNPPVVLDVTVEEDSYGPGDLVHIWVQAQDDGGLASVSAFASGPEDLPLRDGPNPAAPYGIGCADPGGARAATVECVFRLHSHTPGGTYWIRQVTVKDSAGHRTVDQPMTAFAVESPYSDTSAPHIEGIDIAVNHVTANATQSISVTDFAELFLSDETGFANGHVGFTGPNGNTGLNGQCERATDHGTLMCDLYIQQSIPDGSYTLSSVGAQDILGYHINYQDVDAWKTRSLSDLMDDLPVIRVASSSTDSSPPVLAGINFPDRVHRGEPFKVYMNWTEETAVRSVHTWWQASRGNAMMGAGASGFGWSGTHDVPCTTSWETDPHFSCELRFPSNFPLGMAKLVVVGATDVASNSRAYVASEWGWVGDHMFEDDDLHDVALVLEPRPIEGQVAAIDAVINEVQAGTTAEIVYHAPPEIKLAEVQLEDSTGEILDGSCDDGPTTQLGRHCHLKVPDGVEGVFELKALTVDDGSEKTKIYEDAFPLLAVDAPMPDAAHSDQPAKGLKGIMNNVGRTWRQEQANETRDPLWNTTEAPALGNAENLTAVLAEEAFPPVDDPSIGTISEERAARPDDELLDTTQDEKADQRQAPGTVSTPGAGWVAILLALAAALLGARRAS